MNRLLKTALAVGGVLLLAACAREPSETGPDVWQEVSGEPVVSVCYSAAVSTREQIEAYAQSLCPIAKPAVELIDHDNFLNNCPLSKRNRATFLCKAQ